MAQFVQQKDFPRLYAQMWGGGASFDDGITVKHIEEFAKYDIVTLSSAAVDLGNEEPDGELVRRIKDRDPETIVLCYFNMFDKAQGEYLYEIRTKHPDWLLRDRKGNPCRAYNKAYGQKRWALDPRSDWKKFYAKEALRITDAGFDGIFADNTWKYYNVEPANYWDLDRTNDEWIEGMAGFLGYVKGALGDKLLICNGDPVASYLENSDGNMLESFMKIGARDFPEEMERARLVDDMGKILVNFSYYVNDMITKTNVFQWFYTNSLLTDGYFGYGTAFDFWHPEYEIKLGAAKGKYYKKDGVYQRDFEGGKVMVNPTLKDFIIKLEDEFKLWGKGKVKEIDLPSYSGVLLEAC